ncbi:unnamed protein product [Bursaphelenchus xylophilus]|uniref:(pine wood nematode) hypothetical protein n=1 Tax=Bursaphelenchus xylophilus TaxID=6326 RepID=A0A7I8WQE2_BURXY|nr:unnamed protein product [Bursaphelenchus xylophilus]CAG9096474.1 unnamed protein product [Bursaphelenchus xylophilus]
MFGSDFPLMSDSPYQCVTLPRGRPRKFAQLNSNLQILNNYFVQINTTPSRLVEERAQCGDGEATFFHQTPEVGSLQRCRERRAARLDQLH